MKSRLSCLSVMVFLGCSAGSVAPADLAVPGPDARPDAGPVPDRPDLSKIVPWKAVNLINSDGHYWDEYDVRPRAQGGFGEDIRATLKRLAALGVRQVEIQTQYSWSIEAAPYPGTQVQSTVYYDKNYRVDDPRTWGKVPKNRRGDMGLVAHQAPASWDQPTPLATPVQVNQRAAEVLGALLDVIAESGLVPVLMAQNYLQLAESPTDNSGWFNYTDPSRNFDQFYGMYEEFLISMTRLAAQHHAGMLILGSEIPYVAGAGLSTFADGSKMTDRAGLIAGKWQHIIQSVRDTARSEGRPDLVLSYSEINPWGEERPTTQPGVPVWSRVPFWDQLDAVGINFYLPGRWSDGQGQYDTSPQTADSMVVYGETHNFASDTVPNFQDIKDFFVTKKGYALDTRPVLFTADGCTSTYLAAANPALAPFLTLGQQPVFDEQQKLYEAHFKLGEKYGKGWLAGFGFWGQTPTARWGGPFKQSDTTNYSVYEAYFDFLSTPTENTIKTYFAHY